MTHTGLLTSAVRTPAGELALALIKNSVPVILGYLQNQRLRDIPKMKACRGELLAAEFF
jgi:hypothetical protein